MFHDLAVHVAHIERAVRTVREVHRAEPDVRGREEFAVVLHPGRAERHPVRRQLLAMNEVAGDVADDQVAVAPGD